MSTDQTGGGLSFAVYLYRNNHVALKFSFTIFVYTWKYAGFRRNKIHENTLLHWASFVVKLSAIEKV